MTRQPPRRADEHLRWLRAQCANDNGWRPGGPLNISLAGLTGTDVAMLEAIDRLWHAHLHAVRPRDICKAVAVCCCEMQVKYLPLARELIARAMDWGDRDRLWPVVEAFMAAGDRETS